MRIFERPGPFAAGVFAVTVLVARLLGHFRPRQLHVRLSSGVHLHHYVFGIFMLTIAGYLALAFTGPRATFGIALLFGLGVGLTFDEFGIWISPQFQRGGRWDTTGVLIVGAAFLVITLLKILLRRRAGN